MFVREDELSVIQFHHLVLFLLTVYSFSIFGCKDYNQSDFGVDHLVMSMYRVFSCVDESESGE